MSEAVARLRAVTEARGGSFTHHDGGVEDATGVLSGFVARSDILVFSVDCVSHEAALAVKRQCRRLGKPFSALRSSGLGG